MLHAATPPRAGHVGSVCRASISRSKSAVSSRLTAQGRSSHRPMIGVQVYGTNFDDIPVEFEEKLERPQVLGDYYI